MRPRVPDRTGFADNDGVRLHYEVHGDAEGGGVPVLFLSAFCIIDARLWNMQIPHFARHRQCVAYDPPGAGASDRPTEVGRFTPQARVADALAVMDAAGLERAVVVGISQGGLTAPLLAVTAPDRVLGVVMIAPTIPLSDGPPPGRDGALWDRWWRPEAITGEFPGFLEFFCAEVFSEPFSSIGVEDGVAWGLGTSPESVIANLRGGGSEVIRDPDGLRRMLEQLACPVLVIHGDDDHVSPPAWGIETARVLGVEPVLVPGGGHGIQARRPVIVNQAIDRFLDRNWPVVAPTDTAPPRPGRKGAPRVLYLSSPIGLGHVRRDTAVADEMRRLVPDLEVEWLAQPPVTQVLESRGEVIHPASRWLASESAHLVEHLHGHELHALGALRDMDEILAANFFVFQEVVEAGDYNLVVGDEAWDVDHYWHEEPRAKATRFAWLTDMVGVVAIPDKGPLDQAWATEWNAQMLDHVERHPEVRDISVFVGDPDDVMDVPFGVGLPSMQQWTAANYEFSGYITGFDPGGLEDRDTIRARFGVGPDETLCVAAVGGSGVGSDLLETVVHAHSLARQEVHGLRTLAVAGPLLDPAGLPQAEGVDRLGYVPDLHHLLAAADLAVVQGGLTTTMELTAARVPFLYAPLRAHWEQEYHVDHRLRRHHAGRRIDHGIERDALAEAILQTVGADTAYLEVPTDGATRMAERLVRLL